MRFFICCGNVKENGDISVWTGVTLLPHPTHEGRLVGFISPITEIISEELICNLNPAEVCQVVRFLKTTWENSRQTVSQSSPACQYFQWMKNEHGGVNKAIWPQGPGILRISVSCGEKMKHLPVCNPISWWLSVDIGLLREWAGCSGCWCLMRNRLCARGHFWDLTTGAKEAHQHLDTYCPKSFARIGMHFAYAQLSTVIFMTGAILWGHAYSIG